jgi:hypothetical protein
MRAPFDPAAAHAVACRRRCSRKHAVQHSAPRLRAAAVEVTHHLNAMRVVAALGADVALLREIELARRASLLANVCYSSGEEPLFAGARHPVGGMGVNDIMMVMMMMMMMMMMRMMMMMPSFTASTHNNNNSSTDVTPTQTLTYTTSDE